MRPAAIMTASALLAAAGLAYVKRGRPWVVNWGATEAEAASSLPGDDILSEVTLQTTRAITIDAPPERVWPWLLQMGPRPRAGIYTYDWLERMLGIDIENADRILPEHQHMEPGDFFALDEKGTNGLHVRIVEPQHAIVLQWAREESTWAFVLHREGQDRTRLLSRNRIVGSGPAFRLVMAVMEPGSLVMERKMLLGIKERAEGLAAAPEATPLTSNGH